MNEIKLNPCPFCGGKVNQKKGLGGIIFFECTNKNCGAMISFRQYYRGRTERDKYNRRATEIKEKKEQEAKGERLVDANALIEGRVENDPVRIAAMCAPTAFDKEKVIEELIIRKSIEDEKAAAFDEAGDIQNMDLRDSISLAFRDAIKIIEKGGLE